MPSPSEAVAAIGTLLQVLDANEANPVTIAEVRDASGPAMSAEPIDVTNHDTVGFFVESIAGFLDAGSVTFACNFLPDHATHDAATGILFLYRTRARRLWNLVFTNSAGTTWQFRAFVSGFTPNWPVRDALTADVTLQTVGAPDFEQVT